MPLSLSLLFCSLQTTAKPEDSGFIPVPNGSAMYVIQVLVIHDLKLQDRDGNGSLNISLTLKMRNPHGYLSAVDYPALVVSTVTQVFGHSKFGEMYLVLYFELVIIR